MKLLGLSLMMLLSSWSLMAQYAIRGTVSSQSGESLPGANVVLQDSHYATAADADGNFLLENVTEGKYTLSVSFVGFSTYTRPIEVSSDRELAIRLKEEVFRAEEVLVYATRANEKTPTTYSNISSEEIEERNMGQDMPFVLRYTPSVVVTSDAGTGVGYTGIRIRGSDPTRINVTVNGIPINDSESHGTFWVNMPDFASSVNNIQIQRGVGTSTNGAAAFGATLNMQTSLPSQEAYAQLDNSFGSFNTRKHTVIFNTGLINDRWSFEGRLSQIASDGYIDRASSDLRSYYLAGGYYGDKTTIKALTFAGKEVTYQSWYGTPEARLTGDSAGLQNVINLGGEYTTPGQVSNLLNSDRRFNYYLYDNEVDHYQQDHYQLHLNHTFNEYLNVNAALHYTYGRGYYEQYRNDDSFSNYGLPNIVYLQDEVYSDAVDGDGNYINTQFGTDLLNDHVELLFDVVRDDNGDTIRNNNGDVLLSAMAQTSTTDLIRRRWLDNHFYGGTFSVIYQRNKWDATLGGGYNYYDGDHFGEVIWARFAGDSEIRDRYYDNYGRKSDFNVFLKGNFQASAKLNLFGDLQVRTIDYRTRGIDSDLRPIDAGDEYVFFNPKVGITYTPDRSSNLYASFAVGNREPVRTDFIDAPEGVVPRHETLRNFEIGYRRQTDHYLLSANYYLMDYDNQLVLTGAVNDVGSTLRANVPDSYRTGVELVGAVSILHNLRWSANLTLSRNKIRNFTEVVYDYAYEDDRYLVENAYKDTDISFSPEIIAGSDITFAPFRGFAIDFLSKYVGKQYLDNTSNEDRVIDPYFINDLKLGYRFALKGIKNIGISLLINNVFDVKYSSNGYTWGYLYEGSRYQQNNYYPQAGTHFLAALSVTF